MQSNAESHAEETIAEEQAGFRVGRRTTEQIYTRRILCEKYLNYQQNLEEHYEKISKGCRNITILRFADDIDALAEEEQELEALVGSLDNNCTRYMTEISAENTKLMTNSANGVQREIEVKGLRLPAYC